METQQNMKENKPSKQKYIIPAVIILCILAGLIYRAITWTPVDSESKKASEAIIRQAAAALLTTDPNNPINPNTLTDADFAKITELEISGILTKTELSDIKLLEKFINLQELTLFDIKFSEKDIPSWMKMLSKLGIFNLSERFNIDLSPLKNLSNLQNLSLGYTQVSNLEPLRSLTNLQELNLYITQVSNLETIKGLKNLTYIGIDNCHNITDKQVEELKKALPNLMIDRI